MRSLRAPPSPHWLRLLWAAVVIVAMVGVPECAAQHRLRRCQRPPRFAVNSVEPMALTEGRVTLVALLIHTCSFCQRQAAGLNALWDEYIANGSDVSMFIVNGGSMGPGQYAVNFPVYQDDSDEQLWRHVFGGSKDDIFIFNRCGMLTYRIGMPYSYLGYSYVRRAIHNSLHDRQICPDCQNYGTDPHDMMGDAPAVGFGHQGRRGDRRDHSGHHHGNDGPNQRSRNRSQCPRDDELCKELRQARRRWNRLQRERGLGHLSEEQAVRLFSGMMTSEGAAPPL